MFFAQSACCFLRVYEELCAFSFDVALWLPPRAECLKMRQTLSRNGGNPTYKTGKRGSPKTNRGRDNHDRNRDNLRSRHGRGGHRSHQFYISPSPAFFPSLVPFFFLVSLPFRVFVIMPGLFRFLVFFLPPSPFVFVFAFVRPWDVGNQSRAQRRRG